MGSLMFTIWKTPNSTVAASSPPLHCEATTAVVQQFVLHRTQQSYKERCEHESPNPPANNVPWGVLWAFVSKWMSLCHSCWHRLSCSVWLHVQKNGHIQRLECSWHQNWYFRPPPSATNALPVAQRLGLAWRFQIREHWQMSSTASRVTSSAVRAHCFGTDAMSASVSLWPDHARLCGQAPVPDTPVNWAPHVFSVIQGGCQVTLRLHVSTAKSSHTTHFWRLPWQHKV